MTSVLVVFLYPGEPSQVAAGIFYFLVPKLFQKELATVASVFSIAVYLCVVISFQ